MAKSDCATAENANETDQWELDDIAKKYGVAARTVQRWIRLGQFPRTALFKDPVRTAQ